MGAPRAPLYLVLVEALPLHCVAEGLQVLGEAGAAVGGGQAGQQALQGDGVGVLVQEGPHDGHQLGEGLRAPVVIAAVL